MHVYRTILKGTSFLSAAEVVTQACSLARNIILARFLTKADFGVAALLGIILSLFEMSGKMALGQQVVQSRHGDELGFMSSVHFTQCVVGTLSAFLILICAWPVSHFFSASSYLASIMMLALIPLVNGLNNLDVYRRTRQLNFGPLVLTELLPQVVITFVAWPFVLIFQDYRAVLCLLLGKAFLTVSMTHLLAERRFSLRFDARWLRESLKFGWPLLLSGIIQFGNFQGDSMVVAGAYQLSQLGEYSVALTIAIAPCMMMLRTGASLSLPLLAEVQSDGSRFAYRYGELAQIMAVVGCSIMLGVLFCGEQVVVLLFGAKYAGVGALACWLTAAQSLRMIRGATIVATMARGDTVNNLISSSWRLSGLLLAVGVGVARASLTWFAVAAFVGEVTASVAAVVRLASKHGIAPRITYKPAALALACVLSAVAVKWALSIGPYSILNWALLPITICLTIGAFMICFEGLRSSAVSFVSSIDTKLGWFLPKEPRPAEEPIQSLRR
jgi:O-antigen/teichoic acid export membrane protein